MIIVFATPNYHRWFDVFTESFRLTNGNEEKILFNAMGISKKAKNNLQKTYKNIEVIPYEFSIEKDAKKYGVSQITLQDSYDSCTGIKKHGIHRLAMNIYADDIRMNLFRKAIDMFPNEKCYYQMDIDLLFRGNINKAFEMSRTADVGLSDRLRPYTKTFEKPYSFSHPDGVKSSSKITIAFVSILNNNRAIAFVDRWCEIINNTSIKNRGNKKYGQWAIYKAFYEFLYEDKASFWREKPGMNFQFMDGAKNKSKTSKIHYFRTKNKDNDYSNAVKELENIKRGKRV